MIPLSSLRAFLPSCCVFSLLAAACGPPAAIVDRVIDPSSRAPILLERVALPAGAKASAAWVSPEGGALVALRDGRFVAIGDDGRAHAIERSSARDPAFAFVDRALGTPFALASSGAWRFDREVARRVELPVFLGDPRSFAPFGDGALWANVSGLFVSNTGASDGPRWSSITLGDASMQNVSAVYPRASASGREAWVLDGTTLRRLRIDAGDQVTWLDASPGVDLGPVRAIAPLDDTRLAVTSARGVTVISADRIVTDHAEEGTPLPDALGAAGGFAWVGWAGQILRTDGRRWESLVRGVALGPTSGIAVEEGTGATALVIDASGDLIRIDADEALRLGGIADHARVVDTRLDLEALTTRSTRFDDVAYVLDGHPLAHRTVAPWGWGDAGARTRDLSEIELGSHVIVITAKTRSATNHGRTFERTLRFEYASPFGRVPSYAKDVAPIFAARCARCHDSGVAHDLATYDRLRAQSPMVRAAVREARMPPDLLLDPASVAIITAWVDGDSPP